MALSEWIDWREMTGFPHTRTMGYGVFRHKKNRAPLDFHRVQHSLANELVVQADAASVGLQGKALLIRRLAQEPRFGIVLVAGELQTVAGLDVQVLRQVQREVHIAVYAVETDASAADAVFGRATVGGVVDYQFHFFGII